MYTPTIHPKKNRLAIASLIAFFLPFGISLIGMLIHSVFNLLQSASSPPPTSSGWFFIWDLGITLLLDYFSWLAAIGCGVAALLQIARSAEPGRGTALLGAILGAVASTLVVAAAMLLYILVIGIALP